MGNDLFEMNEHAEAMAQALGAPLYRPTRHVPLYRRSDAGAWRIVDCPFHLEPGYVSNVWAVAGLPVLMRRIAAAPGWETWMSITPHEIESQELACDHARGHTVIMGLGMGWIAANVAMRSDVHRVTIVELDADIIALIDDLDCFANLPADARAKIHVVHADAMQWRPGTNESPVDFLFADIWQALDERDTVEQVRRMQANIGARVIYFWGQEIALYRALEQQGRNERDVSNAELRALAARQFGLPLLIPDEHGYGAMIGEVVARRRARNLYPPGWER